MGGAAKKLVQMGSPDGQKHSPEVSCLLARGIDNITASVYLINANGKVVFVNKTFERKSGISLNSLVGSSYLDMVHPKDHERVKVNFQKAMKGEAIRPHKVAFITSDGSPFCVEVRTEAIRENGRFIGLQGISCDSAPEKLTDETVERPYHDLETELRRTRYALTKAREALQDEIERHTRTLEAFERQRTRNDLLLRTVMDGFLVMDRQGKLLDANDSAYQIYGYAPEEIIGMNINDFELKKRCEFLEHRKGIMRRGHERFESTHRGKGGRVVDVEISTRFVQQDGGIFFCFVRDITERTLAYKALREKDKELELKTKGLEELDAALTVLLKKRDEEKREFEEMVFLNMKKLVMPYLERLKKTGSEEKQINYIHMLESKLNEISSPFSRKLSSEYLNLTPTEIQVADFIKHGKTTKEIAEFLNLSGKTIEDHRKKIRKKLGIKNKKTNLRTHLLSVG